MQVERFLGVEELVEGALHDPGGSDQLLQRRLTGPALAGRIAEACAPAATDAAAELGARVARERGLDQAVTLVERGVEAG